MRSIITGVIIGIALAATVLLAAWAGWQLGGVIWERTAAGPVPVNQECIITVPAEEWTQGDGRYRINL